MSTAVDGPPIPSTHSSDRLNAFGLSLSSSPLRTESEDARIAEGLGLRPSLSSGSSNGGDEPHKLYSDGSEPVGLRPRQSGGRFVRWTRGRGDSAQQREERGRPGSDRASATRHSSPMANGVLSGKQPSALRLPMAIAGAAVLAWATLGALLLSLCLYVTVRPWSRAHYRRMLCAYVAAPLVDAAALLLPR
jgi:hypothetical protein